MKIVILVRRHRYELIALLTGASVMMLEIVGARLLAPHFGASLYVWTAMIGVILGALSLGFWWGGRLADRDQPSQDIGPIIAGAGLLVLLMVFIQSPVLDAIANQRLDLRLSAILAAVTLFGVPSFLIGMVSPHLAKIRVTSLETTGVAVGRLEAAGAVGSIAGTFLSGYFLLAYLGARNLSLWLAILLVLTSFLAGWRRFLRLRLALIALTFLVLFYNPLPTGIISDTDSAYSRYQVQQTAYNGRAVRYLLTDSYSVQSASYIDDPGTPVFPYIERMLAAALSHPEPKNILVIGGGAHTFPSILQARLPEARVDVVEIDPSLLNLSEDYFGFRPDPNTRLFYEDGRSFLNRQEGNYDLIFMDAYSSLTPPFHLASREAVARQAVNLRPGGVVVANAATAYDGGFLSSLQRTYQAVFDHVSTYRTVAGRRLSAKQNFLVLASNDQAAITATTSRLGPSLVVADPGLLLTDDYAPVERLSF